MVPLKRWRIVIGMLAFALLTALMPAQVTHAQEIWIGSVGPGNNTCGAFTVNAYDLAQHPYDPVDYLRLEQTTVRYSYTYVAYTTYTLKWTKLTGTPGSGIFTHWESVLQPDITHTVIDIPAVGNGQVKLELSGTFTAYTSDPSLPPVLTCTMSGTNTVEMI